MNTCYGEVLPVLPSPETPQLRHAMILAVQTMQRLPLPLLPDADWDDFSAVARLAAWQALQSYQAGRGADWKTWVISKVRWALKEEARRLDPLTRKQRGEQNQKDAARVAALARGERPPEGTEAAEEVPISLDQMLNVGEAEEEEDGAYLERCHRAGLIETPDWE